jgi:hypothetical protein
VTVVRLPQYQASVDAGATRRDVPGTGTGPFTARFTGLASGATYTVVVRGPDSMLRCD